MKCVSVVAAALFVLASSTSAFAGPGEDLIAKEKCNKCHTEKTTKKGPSFAAVAKKYNGDAAASAKLVKGLKQGGKMGDEEDHKKVAASDAELKAAVDVVLGSK